MNTIQKPPRGCANSSAADTSPRAKSMNGTSAPCAQLTLLDFDSATSSPASAGGVSRSGSPAGRMTNPSGPGAVHASPSARRGRGLGSKTSDISGPTFTGSSASAVLQSFLANRLRARLRSAGLMEYSLTWKELATPAGRRICALRASAHRTSGNDCSGWRSPDHNQRGGGYSDPAKALARMESGHQINLEDQAVLAGWPTASSRDWKDTPGMATAGVNPDGSERKRLDQPPRVAALGMPTTSCHASTERRGALNPAHSAWLMGYTPIWMLCGMRAFAKSKRK